MAANEYSPESIMDFARQSITPNRKVNPKSTFAGNPDAIIQEINALSEPDRGMAMADFMAQQARSPQAIPAREPTVIPIKTDQVVSAPTDFSPEAMRSFATESMTASPGLQTYEQELKTAEQPARNVRLISRRTLERKPEEQVRIDEAAQQRQEGTPLQGVVDVAAGMIGAPAVAIAGNVKGAVQGTYQALKNKILGIEGGTPAQIGAPIAEQFVQQNAPQPTTETGKRYQETISGAVEPLKLPPVVPELLGFAPLAKPVVSQISGKVATAVERQLADQLNRKRQTQPALATAMGIELPQKAPAVVPVAPTAKGMQSGGAAAVAHETAVNAALAEASPEIKALSAGVPASAITPQDLKALEIHNKFAKVGLTPTEGQATQNVAKLSDEYNQRAKPGNEALLEKFTQRDPALINAMNDIKERHAPNAFSPDQESRANAILEDIKVNHVDVDTQNINNAYKALNDANGGKFPVDMKKASENALSRIADEDRLDNIPPTIKRKLDDYLSGKSEGNFNRFQNLSTDIAAETRKAQRAGDGVTAHVLSTIRDALEELPMQGEAATKFKPLADQARALFKNQKDLLTPPTANRPNPKYNKAYAAAATDTRTPEEIAAGNIPHPASKGFLQNFVIGNKANQVDINRMIDLVGRESPAHHELIAGTIQHLKDKAGVGPNDTGAISQAALNKEVYTALGKKLDAIVGSKAANELRNVADVAQLSEHVRNRTGGSANVSQTAITSEREAALKAGKELALGAGEAALNIKTGGASGVVKTILQPVFKAKQAAAEKALLQQELNRRIHPAAGMPTLIKDMAK